MFCYVQHLNLYLHGEVQSNLETFTVLHNLWVEFLDGASWDVLGDGSPATKKAEHFSVNKVTGDGRCLFRALVKGMAFNKGVALSPREERDDAGEVYRGILSDGQAVAIKRAQHGSMQGGLEFKT
ncbi:hypothetical protein CCACVL1_17320 [Corchorus capsularis]|uniref:OTU domain-containing protein n=1 Tax=Corchorus capsularis TaxID=210143 RepID=A0A1R3HSH7_COCAP|nr:hypothetical protein CCACVL1_17320 [Corchorus capsularis]